MTARDLADADLRALRAEIEDGRRRLGELAREVAALDPGAAGTPSRPTLALIAVDLHSYYTIVESVLERILATLEGRSPSGPTAHIELLRRAARPLAGVRPEVVSTEQVEALVELRRFRHFFRHAYALDLRFAKMRLALDPFPALHDGIDRDLDRFGSFLDRLIEELGSR